MNTNLPYMASVGTLPKILNKICEASVPETFNHDFLGTKLGFSGGNQKTFISWAKKCEFLSPDGSPTQIYKDFRNPSFRGRAMAKALKIGYEEAYTRNQYAHELSKKDFTQLVSEITGSAHDNSTVKRISGSFFNAKEFADFDHTEASEGAEPQTVKEPQSNPSNPPKIESSNSLQLGLNYTINLVLPKTDDPAVFNAIFKSLKENLLSE